MPADGRARRTHDNPLTSPCILTPVSALSITHSSIWLAVEGESLRWLRWPCSLLFYGFCFFRFLRLLLLLIGVFIRQRLALWLQFGKKLWSRSDFFSFSFFSACLGFRSRLLNFDFAGPVAEEHSSDLFCTLLCLLDVHSEILDKDCKDFSPTFL